MLKSRVVAFLIVAFVVGVAVGGTIGVFSFWEYYQWGVAAQSARLSSLKLLQGCLVQHAKENGHYPQQIAQAFGEDGIPLWMEAHRIEYAAAGQPYPLGPEKALFWEKEAKHYGLHFGWFLFYEHDWRFNDGRSIGPLMGQ